MDDHVKQLLLLGREHYEKAEYDRAEQLLRQVVEKNDRFADVHHMLGVIAHSQGDFTRAEEHFEKAVAQNPRYTEAQLNLMVTYNELGKYEAARRIYSQIRARADSVDSSTDQFAKGKIANMHAEIAQAYHDIGMVNDAIRELEKAVALCPTFADLRTRLGVVLRDNGDLVRARVEFEAARSANPRYVQGRLALGVLLLGAGEIEAARGEFQAVADLDPSNKSASMYLRLAQQAAEQAGGGQSNTPA